MIMKVDITEKEVEIIIMALRRLDLPSLPTQEHVDEAARTLARFTQMREFLLRESLANEPRRYPKYDKSPHEPL